MGEPVEFVETAMRLSCLSSLNLDFELARRDQVRAKKWDADTLLKSRHLRWFSWDLFFALGGLNSDMALSSGPAFAEELKMRARKLPSVAMVLFQMHRHLEGMVVTDGSAEKGPPKGTVRWGRNSVGVNKASQQSALEWRAIPNGRSEQTIKNDFYDLAPSASLIYAATMVDHGNVFRWLMNQPDPYNGETVPIKHLPKWFALADAISVNLIQPQSPAGERRNGPGPKQLNSQKSVVFPSVKDRAEFLDLVLRGQPLQNSVK
jgi:hypothetical protein